MPRFIGGKFGQQVGISTGHSIKGGGIFDMDDQYSAKRQAGWTNTGMTATGGTTITYISNGKIYK